jgi:lipopolysaccharide export system permease protein
MKPRLIFAYLFAQHLAITLLVLGLLLVVLFLGQFADAARYQDGPGLGSAGLIALAALRTPALLQYVLPHVMLISAALAVYRAGSRFELAILMQSGIAGTRLLVPFFLCGALVGLVYMLAGNPLAAAAYRKAAQISAPAAASEAAYAREVVLADDSGSSYIFADHVSAGGNRLQGVQLIRVDVAHRIDVWVKARQADWIGDRWVLTDAQAISGAKLDPATGERVTPFVPDSLLTFPQAAMAQRLDARFAIPLHRLRATIGFARSIGAPSEWYQVQLHWLLALPLMLGAVSALSAALVIRPLFSGQWGRDAAAVLMTAFVVYAATSVLEALGAGGKIWVPVAEWLVPLAALLAALILAKVKRL